MTVYDLIQALTEYPADAEVEVGNYDEPHPIKIINHEKEYYIPEMYAKNKDEKSVL